jgi:hypothetical protein
MMQRYGGKTNRMLCENDNKGVFCDKIKSAFIPPQYKCTFLTKKRLTIWLTVKRL